MEKERRQTDRIRMRINSGGMKSCCYYSLEDVLKMLNVATSNMWPQKNGWGIATGKF